MNTRTVLCLATIGLFFSGVAPAAARAQTGQDKPTFKEQTSEGSITLRVRPVWNDSTLEFEIAADTHSGDLATLDLRTLVRLGLDGRELEPATATRLSGHHGKATVGFTLPAPPARFKLVIRGVGDVPERTLDWPVTGSGSGSR